VINTQFGPSTAVKLVRLEHGERSMFRHVHRNTLKGE
jgi:hypothetical protein